MGRLLWSFEKAMKTDCLAIELAIGAQNNFLRGLFGSPEKPAELPPLTQGAFRGLFNKAAA